MKKLAVLLALVMVLALLPTSAFAAVNTDYAETLFDHSRLVEVDIRMDDEAWDNMIATASDEVYSACDLVVNGVLYENVAIRPKGNSSLSSVTRRDSERYSWRIKFDKYEKGRTCDGLDILILNNGFNDPGQLSEAIAYDMYAFLEADASLYNYAVVYHNGEYFGVYLALEAVDESFAERNYGEDYGKLYKPDIADRGGAARQNNDQQNGDAAQADGDEGFGASFGGRNAEASGEQDGERTAEARAASAGPAQDGQAEERGASDEGEREDGAASAASAEGEQTERRSRRASGEQNGEASREMGGGFGGRGGSSSSLAMALNYLGDDLEIYQGIWDAEKFKSDDEDHARVVEALKHVCQGDDIEGYLDVENVLKYFAIQTFIYNRDGLTGTVSHNYYLYEEDGKLNLIPWDLNESFSVSGNGSAYVNFPIDTPFTVTDLSQRSFFMALLEDEACFEQYHEYLRQLCEEYVRGGAFEETYERIRSQVDGLIETDPTSFTTYSNFDSTAQRLKTAIGLRAESVLGQLAGDIPSTRDGQNAEPDKLLDTSELGSGSGSSEMRR